MQAMNSYNREIKYNSSRSPVLKFHTSVISHLIFLPVGLVQHTNAHHIVSYLVLHLKFFTFGTKLPFILQEYYRFETLLLQPLPL